MSLLEKFGMTGDSKVKVPMAFGTKLTPSLEKPAANITLYRQMIGSLLYLTSSRPDIMFVRTISLGLWYPSESGFFVQEFSDADLGVCGLDQKSTSGGCQLLDGKLVSWKSGKQTCVSLSTAEAEYIAATSSTSQIIWIQNQLRDYEISMKRIPLYCDSESAIRICHNPVQHSKTKHIALRYHFIKDLVEDGNIEIHFVRSTDQLTDIFTKTLPEVTFNHILQGHGMMEAESFIVVPHGRITQMESLDSHLALIHEEPGPVSQSHMELIVGSCANDHHRPPPPPVPDLYEVELFVLHQESWWDRLQVGITGVDGMNRFSALPLKTDGNHTSTSESLLIPKEEIVARDPSAFIKRSLKPSSLVGSSSANDNTSSTLMLKIKANQNMVIDLNSSHYSEAIHPMIECLKYSRISKALTESASNPIASWGLPPYWNALFTILFKSFSKRTTGTDSASKLFYSFFYGLYHDVNLDFGSIMWIQFVHSVNYKLRHTEISCVRFWSLVVHKTIVRHDIHVMTDSVMAVIPTLPTATFVTTKVEDFKFIGTIPMAMTSRVPSDIKCVVDYSQKTPFIIRPLDEKHQVAFDKLENPKKVVKRKGRSAASDTEKPAKRSRRLRKLVMPHHSEDKHSDYQHIINPLEDDMDDNDEISTTEKSPPQKSPPDNSPPRKSPSPERTTNPSPKYQDPNSEEEHEDVLIYDDQDDMADYIESPFNDFRDSHQSNNVKMTLVIQGFADTLKAEKEALATLRSELKKENSELASSLEAKAETLREDLAMENEFMDLLASKTTKIQVLKADLKHTTAVLSFAVSQTQAIRSCVNNIDSFIRRALEEDDLILTPYVRGHITNKLHPVLLFFSKIKGVSEDIAVPKQGGDENTEDEPNLNK
ncbi:hypothetical protein L2E82_44775 [Cichorium intybus]|uniref:Uncharacterized protein n=1 Tax=Cichorium intybus TaxID=13427 RepID=A0ACB8ZRP3_CICIN|nr:hypothetical protein L2E82_44775 [Cichorium intybus]